MINTTSNITLKTFGKVSLQFGEKLSDDNLQLKRFLLVVYLAERGEAQSREKLANLLWPEAQQSQKMQSLRSLLARLKFDGVEQFLHISRKELDLADRDSLSFDLNKIREIASDFHNSELNELQLLFDLCQGPFLANINLDSLPGLSDWSYAIQHEIETILCQAYLLMTPRLIAAGAAAEAVSYGRIIIELAPYDDQMYLLFVKSLVANGQIAEALKELSNYRHEVLNIYPDHRFSPELVELGSQLSEPGQLARHLSIPIADAIVPPAPAHCQTIWNGENFLIPVQDMIGRETEAQRLQKFLERGFRLISVTGLGGIGKTFFTRSQIPDLAERFSGCVAFIDLRGLENDPIRESVMPQENRLLHCLSERIRIPIDQSLPVFEQVVTGLKGPKCCLILDNFESIYDEARVVGQLLDRLPGLTMIVTSQKALNLSRECLLHFEGLPVFGGDTSETMFGPAVQLFERAAQQKSPDFQLDLENGRTVMELCAELGGLPLAIELLAKQLNKFTLEELLSDTVDYSQLLQSDAIDLPPQHQSVFELLEKMWRKLSDEAKAVLPELTRFSNEWGREEMQVIAPAEFAVYKELLQSSMLQQTQPGTFKLHPLVKRFANGELASQWDKFFVSDLWDQSDLTANVERYSQGLALVDDQDIEVRFDLLFAMINTKLALQEDLLNLLDFCGTLVELANQLGDEKQIILAQLLRGNNFTLVGRTDESIKCLEIALELADKNELHEAKAYINLQMAAQFAYLERNEDTSSKLDEVSQVLDQLTNSNLHLDFMYFTSLLHFNLGEYDSSIEKTTELLQRCQEENRLYRYGYGLSLLIRSYLLKTEFEKAIQFTKEGLEISSQIGHKALHQFYLGYLAHFQIYTGELESARDSFSLYVEVLRGSGRLELLAHSLNRLGRAQFLLGNYEDAEEKFKQAISIQEDVYSQVGTNILWRYYGDLLVEVGRFDEAVKEYQTAELCQLSERIPDELVQTQCGLALALYRSGQVEQGLAVAEKCWNYILEDDLTEGARDWALPGYYLIQVFELSNDCRKNDLILKIYGSVQRLASKIGSVEAQETFLTQIPARRRICQLAQENILIEVAVPA